MKRILNIMLLIFLLAAGFFLSHVHAQEDPFQEIKEIETEIDEELKWLKAETETQFVTVATKTKMSVQDAPSIVSVITGKEIRNMGARNLTDVMRTVPGFDLTSKKKIIIAYMCADRLLMVV